MKTVKIDAREYSLKSSWEDVNKDDFLTIAYIRSKSLFENNQNELNANRIVLFHALSNIPLRKVEKIEAQQWVDILPHLNWCFKTPTFSENIIYQLSFKGHKLYGPVGVMKNVSILEMAHADNAYTKACNDGDPDKIYELFAILWRSKRSDIKEFMQSQDWNGDVRDPYNDTKLKARKEWAKKNVSFHFAVAAFLYYQNFRENQLMKFKNVFGLSGVDPKKRSGNDYGWAGTMLELATTGVFGTLDQVQKQPWSNIMVEISRNQDLRKKMEEQIEKNRKS